MIRRLVLWLGLVVVMTTPIIDAGFSPLLQWRDPVYILGGFAGIVGLVLLVAQPLLVIDAVPGVPGRRGHVWVGGVLVLAVLIHVGALWITSPPDVIDVLLFRSPTPFGIWGAAALWAVFAVTALGIFRQHVPQRIWRVAHTGAATIIVFATALHAWLIKGTMGLWSKGAIVLIVILVFMLCLKKRRIWRVMPARRRM